MTKITFFQSQRVKIGKEPVVILPIKKWREIENALEDLEMYSSENLRRSIAKARKEKKTIPLGALLKKYRA
jgi:sensor domain CHASE-containing protein